MEAIHYEPDCTEYVGDDVGLPREKLEILAVPRAFGVLEHIDECYRSLGEGWIEELTVWLYYDFAFVHSFLLNDKEQTEVCPLHTHNLFRFTVALEPLPFSRCRSELP